MATTSAGHLAGCRRRWSAIADALWKRLADRAAVDQPRVSTSPSGLPGGASAVVRTPWTSSLSSLVPAAACTDGTDTPLESPRVATPPVVPAGMVAALAVLAADRTLSVSIVRGDSPCSPEAREA